MQKKKNFAQLKTVVRHQRSPPILSWKPPHVLYCMSLFVSPPSVACPSKEMSRLAKTLVLRPGENPGMVVYLIQEIVKFLFGFSAFKFL